MLLWERRNALTALLTSSSFGYQTPQEGSTCLSFSAAVQVLQRQCPAPFQRAVRQSGKFLYRGESVTCPTILSPPSDLLDPATYNDVEALAFFTRLETIFRGAPLRPSNGHLGTAHREAAAQWGAPCTIWPLQQLKYMWPRDSTLFYPGAACESSNFVVGAGLEEALSLEKEIMFTSPSFLVIPENYEDDLKSIFFVTDNI